LVSMQNCRRRWELSSAEHANTYTLLY
jgi:hypothetical protein